MNLIPTIRKNFQVLRSGVRSVLCLSGKICAEGVYYDVEELEATDLEVGEYSVWLQQTWLIHREVRHSAVVGLDGAPSARSYQDQYYLPSFEFVVGKDFLQATAGQTVLKTTFGQYNEIFFSKVADITVEGLTLTIENKPLTLIYVPTLRETFGLGQGD